MKTYRVWMKNGSAGLYNSDTPEDAAEQAVEWARDTMALGWSADVTVDKVEELCTI